MTPAIDAAQRALRNAPKGFREQARRKLREALHDELRAEQSEADNMRPIGDLAAEIVARVTKLRRKAG